MKVLVKRSDSNGFLEGEILWPGVNMKKTDNLISRRMFVKGSALTALCAGLHGSGFSSDDQGRKNQMRSLGAYLGPY